MGIGSEEEEEIWRRKKKKVKMRMKEPLLVLLLHFSLHFLRLMTLLKYVGFQILS